ncbi:MAG: C40 family peptidase [Oscillospiraceae bacterium]|jgi:hypothetical protein|nr:C40 family peptidase [Oscillospiraceae bacterium]
MKKLSIRLLCLTICLSVLLSAVPLASAYYGESNWAKDSIAEMAAIGLLPESIVNSDMSANITRGEMCKMAVLVYEQITGIPALPAATNYFTDTKDPAMCFAKEQNIVAGYPDGSFRPNDPLTRQDFFKITYNLMTDALMWDSRDLALVDLNKFSDSGEISNYAVTATQAMVTIGVVKGADGKLLPKSTTSRQEAIAMFLRAYHYVVNWYAEQADESIDYSNYEHGYSGISVWAIGEVLQMEELGLIPGSLASSNMSAAISRQQMCEIALLAYNRITGETYSAQGENHFSDTNNAAVNAGYELGFVDGVGNGKFSPNAALTREQFFKIAVAFMNATGYPRTDSRGISLSNFSDGSKVSSWAAAPTRLLVSIGSVNGSGGKLHPKADISIQETLAVFLRCYTYTVQWHTEHPDGVEETVTLADEIVEYAMTFEGYDYVYGGKSPSTGFDCSGFVYYIYTYFGYSMYRTATDQLKNGVSVSKGELLPGDLVFFTDYVGGSSIGHVGIYIGDGNFIHAANPSKGVIITALDSPWYADRYYGARRIVTD